MNQDFEIENGILIKYHGNDKEVMIPDGVTSIGDSAFLDCYNLNSVIIGNGVTSIEERTFDACDSLISIQVSESNHYYASENGILFNKNKTKLIQYPIGNARTEYVIPDNVTSIGNFSFFECKKLISVNIPDSVTSIGICAFWDCENLTSVTIPDSVTSIGDDAFSNCSGLKSVIISNRMTGIGENAFYNCKNLKHAPLMLIDDKMLYEPERRNGVSFSEIKQLVLQKDYALRINHEVKYNLIFQMYALEIDTEGTSEYISKNFVIMFLVLIDMDDTEIFQKILDSERFITEENIDELIQYAIDQKKYQIQLMLTDYKQKKNWYQNIDEISDKFKL